MKITAILDDRISEHELLRTEHGFSAWIEYDGTEVIFDFGGSNAALHNCSLLRLPYERADFAICSHSHYDHSGGLPYFAENGGIKRLLTGPGFFTPKYSRHGLKRSYIGQPYTQEWLDRQPIEQIVVEGMLTLREGMHVVGNFERSYSIEVFPQEFVAGEIDVPDLFEDEICLVLESAKGLVIVTGCSHCGILNMTKSVSRRLGKPVNTVIGGTHLKGADGNRIRYTVEELANMGVKLLAFMHCSGDHARDLAAKSTRLATCDLATGDEILI